MDGRHLKINAILIREVHLPEVVQNAIHAKLQEEQKALEMRFVATRLIEKTLSSDDPGFISLAMLACGRQFQ